MRCSTLTMSVTSNSLRYPNEWKGRSSYLPIFLMEPKHIISESEGYLSVAPLGLLIYGTYAAINLGSPLGLSYLGLFFPDVVVMSWKRKVILSGKR